MPLPPDTTQPDPGRPPRVATPTASATQARQGVVRFRVIIVLVVSLTLAIVAMLVAYGVF